MSRALSLVLAVLFLVLAPISQAAGSAAPTVAGTSPLSLSTSFLSFGTEGLNITSSFQAVELDWSAANPVTINAVSLSGPNASDFLLQNGCSGSTAAPSCVIAVAFKPRAAGLRTATLEIADSASGAPQSVGLSGNGSNTTASFLFGAITYINSYTIGFQDAGLLPATNFEAVAGSSASQANWVLNTGSLEMNVSESITGPHASDFVLNPNQDPTDCTIGSGLGPLGACTSTISFMPSATGLRSAVLTVADLNSGVSQNFALSGEGLTATKVIALSYPPSNLPQKSPVSALSFGSQTVGSFTQQTFQLENIGTGPVTILSAAFWGGNSSDFSVSNYDCPISPKVVQPGQTCNVELGFAPAAAGYRETTFAIYTDGGQQSLVLTGAAEPANSSPALSAAALDFDFTDPSSVVFTNESNGPINLNSYSISGPNAQAFAITSAVYYVYQGFLGSVPEPCLSIMPAGNYCAFTIQFTPPSTPGAVQASLNISTSAGPFAVALYGMGASSANVSAIATPTMLDFSVASSPDKITQGISQTVQLINPGGIAFQVLSVSVTGLDADQFVPENNFEWTLFRTNQTVTVDLPYSSSIVGSAVATLTVVTTNNTITVPMRAIGVGSAAGVRYQTAVNLTSNVGKTVEFDEYILQTGVPELNYNINATIDGPNAADFSVGGWACYFDGTVCTIPIYFTPSLSGTETASFHIAGTDVSGAPLPVVQLTGIGQ